MTVIIDSREQRPYGMAPMQAVTGGLPTGDYSLRGMESEVALERKELGDLISCCGPGRERFTRELHRLRSYRHRLVIVEATWADLAAGNYRSRLSPKAACHSIISWMGHYGVPFLFAGDRAAGQLAAQRFLYTCAKAEWARGEHFRRAVERGAQPESAA